MSVDDFAAAIGFTAREPHLWDAARTHPSFVNEHPDQGPGYERLEFLGDALIGAAVAQVLVDERPGFSPGQLTFMRSALVRKPALASWGNDHDLRRFIRIGGTAQGVDHVGWKSIVADVTEAVHAVIYLEQGWSALVEFVRAGIASDIPDYESTRRELEPKSVLQEYLAEQQIEPAYKSHDDTDARVVAEVRFGQHVVTEFGRSKRAAEVAVARKALNIHFPHVDRDSSS